MHTGNRFKKSQILKPTKILCQNVYSNVKSYLTQPKYQNMEKQSYEGLFISIKFFIPESPNLLAFSKALECSNKTVNIGAITDESGTYAQWGKNNEILLLATLTSVLTPAKVKCPTGRASFRVKFPTVKNNAPVKCPGYALGEWAILELTGSFLG